jgi:hypothetical protein
MKKLSIFLIILTFTFYSCISNELKGSLKNDFTTSGTLGEDCFQVIITASPDADLKTMTEQRENAFIKAKSSIFAVTEQQILSYYLTANGGKVENLPQEKIDYLKKKFSAYSKQGIIEQEYYLIDNTAILVYRIFNNGIKKEILNN